MSIEIIGITATFFVLLSFLMRSAAKIRMINIVGAALFIIYGFLIGSFSTALLNAALIVIHAVYLCREYAANKSRIKLK